MDQASPPIAASVKKNNAGSRPASSTADNNPASQNKKSNKIGTIGGSFDHRKSGATSSKVLSDAANLASAHQTTDNSQMGGPFFM